MYRPFTGALALLLALAAPAVAAQDTARPAPSADGRGDAAARLDRYVAELAAAVRLTPEQVAQVRPLLQQEMEGRRALMGERGRRGERTTPPTDAQRAERDARREAMRTQMQALQANTDARVLPLLSADQADAYRRFRAEQADRRGRRAPGNG